MDNKILEEFKKYSPLISTLNNKIKSNICELIFCMRNDVLSTVIVMTNKELFLSLVGKVPVEILNADTNRYFVDLESINSSDYTRVYVDKSGVLHGYYINSGSILEKKIYNKTSDRYALSIDRYNEANQLISENEIEVKCTENDWVGPKELVEIAEKYNLTTNYLKKTFKPQCYLRVRQL